MKYDQNSVSAAISTVADRCIQEAGIKATETDRMAIEMSNAEKVVVNEMVRQGMSMQEASALAAKAVLAPGRDTNDSKTLAEDAYRNRSIPVANDDTPMNDDKNMIESEAASQAPGSENPVNNEEQNMAGAEAVTSQNDEDQQGSAMPAKTGAKAHLNLAAVDFQEATLLEYEIIMRKVSEVFRNVDEKDAVFDFEIPVVNWKGRHEGVPEADISYLFDQGALHSVLYGIATGTSVNIVGPHGCGKTELVSQIAARLNFPVTIIPMDGQLSRRELIGKEKLSATAAGTVSHFVPGILPRAMMEPGFILFDEVDRGVSDLQYACHSVYLQQGLKILEDEGRTVPFHEHNRVFATANTKGRGSLDGMYQASEEMSEATRDRWSLWIEMDYNEADEDVSILQNKVPGLGKDMAEYIAKLAADIRSAYKGDNLEQTISMRQQLEVAKMTAFLNARQSDQALRIKGLAHAIERVICGRASPQDQGAIRTFVEARVPEAYQGDPLF